jgi:hypothetical protein
MKLHGPLLRWHGYWLGTLTLLGWMAAIPWLLFHHDPLRAHDMAPAFFVAVHSLAIVALLGRFRTGAFGFLYSRGYSRDTLWTHAMLAGAAGVLSVWLPAALVVWTPLRSCVQDRLFLNPYFPIMAPAEAAVPWTWLFAYAVLVPTLHYAWIRQAAPYRGGSAGAMMAVAVAFGLLCLVDGTPRHQSARLAVFLIFALIAATALASGWRLHRELEGRA